MCNGLGICGCGRDQCIEPAWWFQFLGTWRLIAFEIEELWVHERLVTHLLRDA